MHKFNEGWASGRYMRMKSIQSVENNDAKVQSSEQNIPKHVAIIMDGNGRWAAARGLKRTEGHKRGVETVRNIVEYAGSLGIQYLTLYSFSSENWTRPAAEIADLMGLLKFFIRHDLMKLKKNGVRIRVIGMRDNLSGDLCAHLEKAEEETKDNTAMTLVVAFNYGARDEITNAVREIASQVQSGKLEIEDINGQIVSQSLDTYDIPDPDVIIRTSGEQRLSNFLLWQSAYSELIFIPVLWPDFSQKDLDAALIEYSRRERRFGSLEAIGDNES